MHCLLQHCVVFVWMLWVCVTDLFPDPSLCSGDQGCCELDTYIELRETAQNYCRKSLPLVPRLLPCIHDKKWEEGHRYAFLKPPQNTLTYISLIHYWHLKMGNPIAGSEFGMQIVRAVTSTFKYLGVDASWAQETFKLWRQKHKSIASLSENAKWDSPACVVVIMLQHRIAEKTRIWSAEHQRMF